MAALSTGIQMFNVWLKPWEGRMRRCACGKEIL